MDPANFVTESSPQGVAAPVTTCEEFHAIIEAMRADLRSISAQLAENLVKLDRLLELEDA